MSLLEILTALTLGVLIVYTIETYKLRKAAQKQVEISMKPIVAFQSCTVETTSPYMARYKLLIRNLGSGPAFNVEIQPIHVAERVANFEFPRMLAPGEEHFVTIIGLLDAVDHGRSGNITDTKSFQKALQKCKDRLATTVLITCKGANGKKYQTTFTIRHDSTELASFVIYEHVKEI